MLQDPKMRQERGPSLMYCWRGPVVWKEHMSIESQRHTGLFWALHVQRLVQSLQ